MKDGSCLVNAVSPLHIVRCSQRFAAFFGYTADELHTRSLKCLFGDEPSDFEVLIQSFKSEEHLLHYTVMITLCESYEYITGDETGYSVHVLQDDSIDGLNTNKSPRQRRCTRDHSQLVEALDEDRFDHCSDHYQDREFLQSTISKASCQVTIAPGAAYVCGVNTQGRSVRKRPGVIKSTSKTFKLYKQNRQRNRLSADMQDPPCARQDSDAGIARKGRPVSASGADSGAEQCLRLRQTSVCLKRQTGVCVWRRLRRALDNEKKQATKRPFLKEDNETKGTMKRSQQKSFSEKKLHLYRSLMEQTQARARADAHSRTTRRTVTGVPDPEDSDVWNTRCVCARVC